MWSLRITGDVFAVNNSVSKSQTPEHGSPIFFNSMRTVVAPTMEGAWLSLSTFADLLDKRPEISRAKDCSGLNTPLFQVNLEQLSLVFPKLNLELSTRKKVWARKWINKFSIIVPWRSERSDSTVMKWSNERRKWTTKPRYLLLSNSKLNFLLRNWLQDCALPSRLKFLKRTRSFARQSFYHDQRQAITSFFLKIPYVLWFFQQNPSHSQMRPMIFLVGSWLSRMFPGDVWHGSLLISQNEWHRERP